MKNTQKTTLTKWLIGVGTLTGTLTGWIFLVTNTASAASNVDSVSASNALNDLLANPLPTLAVPPLASPQAISVTTAVVLPKVTVQPTLRTVLRPTAVPVYSSGGGGRSGGSAPAASTGSSKK